MAAANGPKDEGGHLPLWKAGGSGQYADTLGKLTSTPVHSAQPLILSLLDTIPVRQGGVFTIADYGTNDGFASMSLMTSIIRELRERHGESLPVQIVYEDHETNDFNSLFRRLSDESSYMSKFNNVYPMATNVNFYKQCVPDNTCDIILCGFASHWLEKLDTQFSDCVLHSFASQEEQRSFDLEAERDWVKFLTLRARELKPGGLLIVLTPSACDSFKSHNVPAREAISTEKIPRGVTAGFAVKDDKLVEYTVSDLGLPTFDFHLDLHAAWSQLKTEGIITPKEYKDCKIGFALRTMKQLTSPLTSEGSPVSEAGLSLVHHDQIVPPCVFKTLWLKRLLEEGEDDRDSFAENVTTAHRVWSESPFENSLSDMRSAEEKAAILDKLYRAVMERIARQDPRSYKNELILARLVIRKERE